MRVVAEVRIDKWLWAVRLYKSRSIATAACSSGKVRIGGQIIKPARSLRVGEVVSATSGEITRTVRVITLIGQRVGAPDAVTCYEDLTPPSEYQKLRLPAFRPILIRPKGRGRPTKRDRRKIERLGIIDLQ
jgi:ribosome-associated heat shock protein Hsp15